VNCRTIASHKKGVSDYLLCISTCIGTAKLFFMLKKVDFRVEMCVICQPSDFSCGNHDGLRLEKAESCHK
jgi:hypothetical protein